MCSRKTTLTTINLALLPLDCLKKDVVKIQKALVYDPLSECLLPVEKQRAPPSAYPAKPIKVCPAIRLESVHPPPLCICPPRPKPLTREQRRLKRFIYVAKAGVFLVIFKWTCDIGMWGDADNTDRIANETKAKLKEIFDVRRKDPRTGEQIYDMNRLQYNLKTLWNVALDKSLATFSVIPNTLRQIFAWIVHLEEKPKKVVQPEKDEKKDASDNKQDKQEDDKALKKEEEDTRKAFERMSEEKQKKEELAAQRAAAEEAEKKGQAGDIKGKESAKKGKESAEQKGKESAEQKGAATAEAKKKGKASSPDAEKKGKMVDEKEKGAAEKKAESGKPRASEREKCVCPDKEK